MRLYVEDVNPARIGQLAPQGGGEAFHQMHHTKDITGEPETRLWRALANELAPHMRSDEAAKAADVTPKFSDGSVPVLDKVVEATAGGIDRGVDKMAGFMGGVSKVAENTTDVVIAGTAISAALAAMAVDAVAGLAQGGGAPKSEKDGLELFEQHADMVLADALDDVGVDASSIGQFADPTSKIEAAEEFAQAKQEAAFGLG